MKFKLNKSKYSIYFNMLKLINKSNLINKENKQVNNNSLIFYNYNNKLHVTSSNSFFSEYFDLEIDIDSDDNFAVDINLFSNALNNFPSEEINFAYIKEKSSLVLGNKKTKVILNANPFDTIDDYLELNLKFNDSSKFKKLNSSSLINCLKYTSFCCSSINEDHPYTNILISVENNIFSGCSTDKHRISIFGDSNFEDNTFLLSKFSSELLMSHIKEFVSFKYTIDNNKLFLWHDKGLICTIIDHNAKVFSFSDLCKFIDNSENILSTKIDKNDFTKSLKFISSISTSDTIDFRFLDNKLFLSNSNSDKGAVADTILLTDNFELLEATYLSNHIIKVADLLEDDQIKIEIKNYNGYKILVIESSSFKHILFPME